MKNTYRVLVKAYKWSSRYEAIEITNGNVSIAPTNKIYHSYFTKENAEKLAQEMREQGLDTKVAK